MSPDELARILTKLGCFENPRHSRKNYRWFEVRDEANHQVAIFNIPVAKNPIPNGTLVKGILNPNGIRDTGHLQELRRASDPIEAFRKVLPKHGARYQQQGADGGILPSGEQPHPKSPPKRRKR